MKYILLIIIILLTIYLVFTGCSFDYDNHYANYIGDNCDIAGDEMTVTPVDHPEDKVCLICAMNANEELVWFKMECEE